MGEQSNLERRWEQVDIDFANIMSNEKIKLHEIIQAMISTINSEIRYISVCLVKIADTFEKISKSETMQRLKEAVEREGLL